MNGDVVFFVACGSIVAIDFMRTVFYIKRSHAKSVYGRRELRLRKEEKLKRHLGKWADAHMSQQFD